MPTAIAKSPLGKHFTLQLTHKLPLVFKTALDQCKWRISSCKVEKPFNNTKFHSNNKCTSVKASQTQERVSEQCPGQINGATLLLGTQERNYRRLTSTFLLLPDGSNLSLGANTHFNNDVGLGPVGCPSSFLHPINVLGVRPEPAKG